MPDQIVIEGDIIRYQETIIRAEAPLSAMLPHLTTRLATTLPILPEGTAYVSIDPEAGRGMLMVQQKPRRAHLNINGQIFNLQLPYQFFIFDFSLGLRVNEVLFDFVINNSYLYWRTTPYDGNPATDEFWPAQLPNVRGASICWGNTAPERGNFADHIQSLVNSFTTTLFNNELGLNTPDYGSDYGAWHAASEDDPLLFLRWNFWSRMQDEARTTTLNALYQALTGGESIPTPADFTNSVIHMPETPRNMTYGRTAEWLHNLEPAQQRRIIAAAAAAPRPRGRDIEDPPNNPDPNGILTGATE